MEPLESNGVITAPAQNGDLDLHDTRHEPVQNGDLDSHTTKDDHSLPTRRSTRSRKAPSKYDEEYIIPASSSPPRSPNPPRSSRPKRRAAAAAAGAMVPEDAKVILEEVVASMGPSERSEWSGWVELESDPAFFTAMLTTLGAPDFKVEEVMVLDELALLPDPVGLVFLFNYTDGDPAAEQRQDCPAGLWFGNQTTANACATVALTNIIMNAPDAHFGPELQRFKDETKALKPPERGHMLDRNEFIRGVHNLVARRTDLLAEDLLLDNKFEKWDTARRRRLTGGKKGGSASRKKTASKASKRKKANAETANHYIAYVPADGQIWELDGFESQPLSLGHYDEASSSSWLDIAATAIRERMVSVGGECNLLGVCRTQRVSLTSRLASNLHTTLELHSIFNRDPSWAVQFPALPNTIVADANVASFGLDATQINAAPLKPALQAATKPGEVEEEKEDLNIVSAADMMRSLQREREEIESQYMIEDSGRKDAMGKIQGRQHDYSPVINAWVQMLAEKGVLRDMLATMEDT